MHFHWEGAEQSGGKKDSLKINEDVCDEKKFYLQQKKIYAGWEQWFASSKPRIIAKNYEFFSRTNFCSNLKKSTINYFSPFK